MSEPEEKKPKAVEFSAVEEGLERHHRAVVLGPDVWIEAYDGQDAMGERRWVSSQSNPLLTGMGRVAVGYKTAFDSCRDERDAARRDLCREWAKSDERSIVELAENMEWFGLFEESP